MRNMNQFLFLFVGILFFILLASFAAHEMTVFINFKSALLVLSGTLISAFMAHPLAVFEDLVRNIRHIYTLKSTSHAIMIQRIVDLAVVRRFKGLKSLEEKGIQERNPFLRKGIELIVDGRDRFEIMATLEKLFEIDYAREKAQLNILNTLIKLAPVFGFIGTIIGLINVLNHMGNPSEIGKGMAVALLTTLYGLLFANVLFMPIARKFADYMKSKTQELNLIMEGVMDISENLNSKAIDYRLKSFLMDAMPDDYDETTVAPAPVAVAIAAPHFKKR